MAIVVTRLVMRCLLICAVLAIGIAASLAPVGFAQPPTAVDPAMERQRQAGQASAEEYAKNLGGDARVAKVGELILDGHKVLCGLRPTVLVSNLDASGIIYGVAKGYAHSDARPGFIILNTGKLAHEKPAVQLWVYNRACGHQFRGPDPLVADCFSVQRGRRQKWMNEHDLDEICRFIGATEGDAFYPPGERRCKVMRECYADPNLR